jgi:hypothetical protein
MIDVTANGHQHAADVYVRVEDIPRWIPASERLPESLREVLTLSAAGIVIGYVDLSDDRRWHAPHCDNETGEPWISDSGYVTHWMPLPEPPEWFR